MRRFVIAAVVGVALLLSAASPAAAETFRVRIVKGDGFRPASVTIKVGDSVRWTNGSGQKRQIVSNSGAFASPILNPGTDWTFTFRASGNYRYHDGFRSALKGVVHVQGPPPSVSMAASLPVVIYGTQVTLSGVVSSKKEGQTVPLLAQPYPQTSFAELAKVTTTAGGAWAFTVTPTTQTTYQARFRGSSSQPVTIGVRPKVTLSYARGYMSTRVTAAAPLAGRFVWLQRRSRFGQWIAVRKLKLGPRSGRIFRPPNRRGVSIYRIYLTVNQAGPGYLSSHSGTQRVVRRG
jgi:plastocyanin